MALKQLFPFQQAQYAQVFPLKSVPSCKLFAGLGSTNKSATSLLFSFLILALSSPPCPLLHLSFYLKLWQVWQELSSLSSCSIRLQWVPGRSFLPGNDSADELARRGALLVSSEIPCSLFPLLSFLALDSYCLIEILRHTSFFDCHPGICVSTSCSMCSLSPSLQRTKSSVKLLPLKNRQNRESFLQRLQTPVPEHLSSHSALSSYGLYDARSLAFFCLSTTSGSGPGKLPGFWGSMVFRHAPIPPKGSGNNNNNNNNNNSKTEITDSLLQRFSTGEEFQDFRGGICAFYTLCYMTLERFFEIFD